MHYEECGMTPRLSACLQGKGASEDTARVLLQIVHTISKSRAIYDSGRLSMQGPAPCCWC